MAWHQLGWEAAGFAEIEPFPAAVLAHHYPAVKNLGDMTNYKEWDLGTIDLLVGGTPCQSFSVAGLRKGLADPRGNLALVYCGILDHFRPKWCVWENVPGVLSSNGGRDFGSFLGALAELGYGFAYRVLDAQYFGVAQRRRRVFVVGYLGDWRPAAEVLFEPESLRRDTAPSRETGQKVAGTFEARANSGGWSNSVDHAAAGYMQPVISHDPAPCLETTSHDYSRADGFTMVALPIALADISSRDKTQNGAGWKDDGTMYTLDTTGLQGVAQPIPFDTTQITHPANYSNPKEGDPCHPLAAGAHVPAIAQPTVIHGTQDPCVSDVAFAQGRNSGGENVLIQSMAVRRLTPVECERLQGFPDNYTNIPWRKQPESPDGPRYKALGNSMAVPVMGWIGKRIQMRAGA